MRRIFQIVATDESLREFVEAQIDWIDEFESGEFWYFIFGEDAIERTMGDGWNVYKDKFDLRKKFKAEFELEVQVQKLFDWWDRDYETKNQDGT